MPIMTYAGFKRMTGFCKTKVPAAIADKLESIKDDEEAVRVRRAGREGRAHVRGAGVWEDFTLGGKPSLGSCA